MHSNRKRKLAERQEAKDYFHYRLKASASKVKRSLAGAAYGAGFALVSIPSSLVALPICTYQASGNPILAVMSPIYLILTTPILMIDGFQLATDRNKRQLASELGWYEYATMGTRRRNPMLARQHEVQLEKEAASHEFMAVTQFQIGLFELLYERMTLEVSALCMDYLFSSDEYSSGCLELVTSLRQATSFRRKEYILKALHENPELDINILEQGANHLRDVRKTLTKSGYR